jgi:hypothetical protein
VDRKGEKRPIFEGETPPKKCTPNIGADIGAITGILLIIWGNFEYVNSLTLRDTDRFKKEKRKKCALLQ